ncbi:MAG: hypothetical protein ABI353_09210, partial [Isosphaeraceae bacterium]
MPMPTLFSTRRVLIVALGTLAALAACAGRSASPPIDAGPEPQSIQTTKTTPKTRSVPHREVR